jgi:hypothetical protein
MGHHTPGGPLVANWSCRLVNTADTILRKTWAHTRRKKNERERVKREREEEHKVIKKLISHLLYAYLFIV